MDHIKKTVIDQSPNGRYICYNDRLGSGATKRVYRGYDTETGKEIAWNIIQIFEYTDYERQQIVNEIHILKNLSENCEYILKFYDVWINFDGLDIILITELATGGTLHEYINKIKNVKINVIKKWCIQILKGLEYAHNKNIVHRDIKCSNIFVSANTGNVMIGDFGLAKRKLDKLVSIVGTPPYMASEIYKENYDEKIDIFAFGMSLLEMVTHKIPYEEYASFEEIRRNVIKNNLPKSFLLVTNPEIKRIILWCTSKKPKNRPSAKELLNDHFFKIDTVARPEYLDDKSFTKNYINIQP